MTLITLYTTKGCTKCPAAKKLCREVAEETGSGYEEVDLEEHMIEALQRQIASAPTIVINREVAFRSVVPTKQELMSKIKELSR
ncbi:glutaredoxin [Candidatus Woesearchaeota archaeon CG08_land_8_20_14_0_20_47_9]|nr:MAG: hypothetical protein AUJ69_00775 [Candidatus Woesearchaeota archaeon CG1_02_47_18]PIN76422.1 MAG: glutaredoxin [Candidatus Woesearchaeota archaeon CG10_big_fil_rev_8_21_14_0_10_47_5]PIO03453.1 MAG: glutaredoxin [Candidatus Woesearchaeota archaeon CG08_land_8_20_14_0_20_47_9]HII30208.1 thioredoxin family protein [Candidatus Woesearchaeota archaeon]